MYNFKSKYLFLSFVPLFSFASKSEKVNQTKPNILWINLDDCGIELGCYNNKDVKTPNIDRLAAEGILYNNCYAAAPVSSASRSAMITGMYPSSVNCLDHQTEAKTKLPDGIVPITELFKNAGYFCTNGDSQDMTRPGKEDYNFITDNLYDGTDWSQRAKGQPFFAQIQSYQPKRSFVRDRINPINPDVVHLPACYLNHPLLRMDWAMYLESVQTADQMIGKVLTRLENEGIADNTIVILFGDNGRPHLRDKQFLYEGGLRVPLIIRWPAKIKPGQKDKQLVSLIDVAATSLSMAGIKKPDYMQGNIFRGEKTVPRKYVFAARQRMGNAIDDSRSIMDGRYKLIWNRMPEVPWMQVSGYKKVFYPAFALYHVLHQQGKLPAPYNQFMAKTKPVVELYDLKADPMEFNNLANNRKYLSIQNKLFKILKDSTDVFDKNQIPEKPEFTEMGKNKSKSFFENNMRRIGLKVVASDVELLNYWESTLLKNKE